MEMGMCISMEKNMATIIAKRNMAMIMIMTTNMEGNINTIIDHRGTNMSTTMNSA